MSATIVMAYYDNPRMLQLQLHEWRMYRDSEKAALRVVIVDDGSPTHPAKDVILDNEPVGFPIKLFRVTPNIPWNQDGARNLAMQNVETQWALMTDMDHMLERRQVSKMLDFVSHNARVGTYYLPARVDFDSRPNYPHANSYVFNVADFWKMGGYDEDFAGVYGSDGNFRKCAKAVLSELQTVTFNLTRWTREAIPDASTNEWGRKDSPYHRSQHPALEAKMKGPAYKAKNPVRFEWAQELE
jgi:hypothetical protein